MRLENIVIDSHDPARAAAFWTAALGLRETYSDDAHAEARLEIPDGPWLDLCFQRVATDAPPYGPGVTGPRLHLDLAGGPDRDALVTRLEGLGALPADIGQGDVTQVVLADPARNLFCVLADDPFWAQAGPLADIPVDSADPARDAAFWARLSDWEQTDVDGAPAIRHPSGRGPYVSFWPEPAPKRGKNRMHLDVRPTDGDTREAAVERALADGATLVEEDWATGHPWTVMADPSGNEFCILDAD